jgi:hypothetical protein
MKLENVTNVMAKKIHSGIFIYDIVTGHGDMSSVNLLKARYAVEESRFSTARATA